MSTNIKNLLVEAGIEEVRPTDKALVNMGISRRRFTQLLENINKTPISVHELEGIKEYIRGFQEIDLNALVRISPKDIDNKII